MSREFPIVKDYKDFLNKSRAQFRERYNKAPSSNVRLSDFERIRTIGTGSFGRVMLVRHEDTGIYYAMKTMEKSKIVKQKQLDHALNEKKILESIRFPFVIHMEYFIKDNSYIYFIMPFVCGGEMFTHLRKFGKFDEGLSKFYAAQVILSLEYLHYLDLVYRDLKPENILIDTTGYLKIADMGFCKLVKGRTYTLCGTPDYIAPEIILGKGYGKAADWWSLGILIYEMNAGYPPFYHRDTMKIYEKIVAGKYRLPGHFSNDVRDLLRNILQVDLTRRYGNLKSGVDDIKSHKWLRHIDWLPLLNKKLEAPYIPKIKSAGDASNFDQYIEQKQVISEKDVYWKEFEKF